MHIQCNNKENKRNTYSIDKLELLAVVFQLFRIQRFPGAQFTLSTLVDMHCDQPVRQKFILEFFFVMMNFYFLSLSCELPRKEIEMKIKSEIHHLQHIQTQKNLYCE